MPQNIAEKPLPQNEGAEARIIGSILLDNNSVFKIIDFLSPEDFYRDDNKKIFAAILRLLQKKSEINLTTLYAEEPISRAHLIGCSNSVMSSSAIVDYAKIVKEMALRRRLIEVQSKNISAAIEGVKNIESLIADSQNDIFKICIPQIVKDDTKTILKELENAQDEYMQKYALGQLLIGIPCGIERIDNMVDGLRPGHIWVIGAWTSTGKTFIALNVIHNVAEQGIPVSVISLEMSRVDLAARLIGVRHNLSAAKILKGRHDVETLKKIEEGKEFLKKIDLEIHTTYFSLEKIKMLIRKDVFMRKVRFVVLDYVQNILSDRGLREYDLLTQAATDLQALARELGITILIISQISNESEKGQAAGAGFKGTGALEAVADLAIRLKRERDKEDKLAEFVPLKLSITKNRHGFTGVVDDYVMWLKSGKLELKNPVQKPVEVVENYFDK